jgi:hypothetical protein
MADIGQDVFDSFPREVEVRHEFADGGFGFVVFVAVENAYHFKAGVRSDVFLVVGYFELEGERFDADQQFVGDLAEVVEDEQYALFHGVHQRSADVLELSEFLLAHEVAQETVQLYGFIEPDFDILRVVIFWEVLKGDDALLSQLYID